MPKRKRAGEESLEEKLPQYRTDIFRALKKVKGYERQRQSRHLHDSDTTAEKKQRLEQEVVVLKSLDLHQTASHYLCSSLVRIKPISNHPNFPEELRATPPKPNISEEERATLHHVTSCLFNRLEVKEVMEKIVGEVCGLLEVPLPEKKRGKRKRTKDYEKEKEQGTDEKVEEALDDGKLGGEPGGEIVGEEILDEGPKENIVTTDERADVDEEVTKAKLARKKEQADMDAEAEEKALAKFNDLLGGSSDGDDDSDDDEGGARLVKGRSIRIRDMSISLSPEPEPSPPPLTSTKTRTKKATKPATEPVTDSTFLPSLMGGYISGSESASDVEIAPRKNRLGQRQRQLRAERKYGHSAKHLNRQRKNRDDGWDMKRGAVGEDARHKPWKRGITNPLTPCEGGAPYDQPPIEPPPRKNAAKKDDGPLHPSWEAKKRAKEVQQKISAQPTAANKIVFDD